ncbi:MAG TPA: hypothetical protein VHM91_01960 [Verrucomicrobiales bacterium]|jgi:hypothetical protein|nr:hypothetical protein [Verrucomicrobiales bacterium]
MKRFLPVCSVFFLAILAPAAKAVPAAFGDLILGFKATGGTGTETNLEVNLGPASQFYGAAAGSTQVLTGLSVDDLKAVYGDDWNTRTDLTWGIAGTTGITAVNGVAARTIWASRAEAVPGTPSTPWPRDLALTQQNSSNAIGTMYKDAPGSIDHFAATPFSATASRVISSLEGSWTVQDEFTPSISFRRFNPSVNQPVSPFPGTASALDGTSYKVLDLWEMRPSNVAPAGSAGILIGGFGLNSAGKLVFSTDVTKFAPGTTPPVSLGTPVIVRNVPAGTITVSLAGVPNGSYILERSTSMADGTWTDLLTQSPSSGTLSFTDPAPPAPRAFYRIKTAP